MKKKSSLTLAFLLVASLVSAQSIDKWTLRLFNTGAASPLSTTDLLAANVVCNQVAPVTTSTVNPNKAIFDDPLNVGKVCIWTDPGTGPLFSVPFGGTFEGSLSATDITGASAESARSPFTRPGFVPAVPTGLRLIR